MSRREFFKKKKNLTVQNCLTGSVTFSQLNKICSKNILLVFHLGYENAILMFSEHFNIFFFFFLDYMNVKRTFHLIIVQPLGKRFFWMLSEHSKASSNI